MRLIFLIKDKKIAKFEQDNDEMYQRMLEKLQDQKQPKSGMKMMDMNEETQRFIIIITYYILFSFKYRYFLS